MAPTAKPPRDPARTRRNLLDAAYQEFAESGYHGASIQKVCDRAGVSKQILSHHFGAKQDVHLTVLERAYETSRARDPDLDPDADPVQTMHRLVSFAFDNLHRDRAFVRLLADENINRGHSIRRSAKLRKLYVPLIATIARVLERGEAAKLFRPGIDPVQLYISISALCFFPFSNVHTLSAVLAIDLSTEDAIAARRAHVLQFIMSAIAARPDHAKGP